MHYVRQPPGSFVCGQTCVAMVTDRTLEEAIELVGHAKSTNTRELVAALRKAGVNCADKLRRISKKWPAMPRRAIVAARNVQLYRSHWIVYWDGKVYDPDDPDFSVPPYPPGWEMTSYLEIFKEG